MGGVGGGLEAAHAVFGTQAGGVGGLAHDMLSGACRKKPIQHLSILYKIKSFVGYFLVNDLYTPPVC